MSELQKPVNPSFFNNQFVIFSYWKWTPSGCVSLILYGMISSVGVHNLVEEKVDLKNSRNVFVAALILVLAIGVKYGANDDIAIGPIHLSGLAIAAIVGIFINAIMPSKINS